MRWAGLHLVNLDDSAPDRRQRMTRFLVSYVSMAAVGIGVFWALLDEEQLTWHDHVSGTFPTPKQHTFRYNPVRN
jgi:uncharacterized RDD family membrane protein YckC